VKIGIMVKSTAGLVPQKRQVQRKGKIYITTVWVNPNKNKKGLGENKGDANNSERQLSDVRKKYEGTAQWMKAPNGKDTNLNEKQWLQVRTPNFKKWFGDWENDPEEASKAVDKNGEPLVVYHGTHVQFDEFDNSKGKLNDAGWLGAGHYFYGDEYESSGYAGKDGHVMRCFLNVREPYYLDDDEHNELADRDDREYSIEFSENLKSDGYDGVYYNGDLRQEWMVFNSNRIKSATDNAGNFNPNERSIKKAMLKIGLRVNAIMKSQTGENKLEYFRKLILDHLSKLEREENSVSKSLSIWEMKMQKAGFPIGTIRTWKGENYIKTADKKTPWKRKYDNSDHTRGSKMALSALKKKISAAKNEREMMQLCLLNRDRFSDKDGHPLPFMQELHDYIEEQKAAREKAKKTVKKTKKKPKAKKTFIPQPSKVKMNDKYGVTDEFYNRAIKPYLDGSISLKRLKRLCEMENLSKNMIDRLAKKLWEETHPDPEKEIAEKQAEEYKKIPYEKRKKMAEEAIKRQDEMIGNVSASERVMKDDFDLLEGYVNKEVSRTELRQKLADKGYSVKDVSEIENLAATLKPSNPAMVITDLADDKGNVNEKYANKTPEELFKEIQNKYKAAKTAEGDEDEIQVGKVSLSGKWKIVEADTPTASHDENTFNKTPGFPTNADGSSINDRDYEHFQANKEAVYNIASDYDGRALKFDSPIVVTKDGIVISGNNRTMSSKIAAKKGTDKKYIEALKKRAKRFGFTEEQVGEFKNPRVVFEVEQKGEYSTSQFAKFNESGKKEMGPTEKTAKVSKMIKTDTIEAVAKKIDEFDTIGELYQDASASRQIYAIFKEAGLIGENESGRYFENGTLTDDGKTFIETALLGTVINETNLRGFNRPGCKSIRGTLMRALIPLVENKGMTGYSINKELNEAVDIAMQVAINKDKIRNVSELEKQNHMFEVFDPVAIELAKKMEGTQKMFADFMKTMNGGLKVAANGEVDIFLGKVESKDDILSRFLNIKKTIIDVLNSIPEADLIKSLRNLEG
jgi:hypothetical protein